MKYFIEVWLDRIEIGWKTVFVTHNRERAIEAYKLIDKYIEPRGYHTLQLLAVSDNSITTICPEGW